jgi:Leucine-rich repeat (LRR) protein
LDYIINFGRQMINFGRPTNNKSLFYSKLFQNLSSLAVLNLDNNQITEIYSYTFYGLKKLKKLTYNLIIQLLK